MKLSSKNKIFIVIFVFIIGIIIFLLVSSAMKTGKNNKYVLKIDDGSILFMEDTNTIKSQNGGKIEEKWNGDYYYLEGDSLNYLLGRHPLVYDALTDNLVILGEKYQVQNDGSVTKIDDVTTISDNLTYFYKLEDRLYLIVSKNIETSDKTIYANKYLLVSIDKQGNASLLNDMINVKTINPIKLIFSNYIFDVANEKLIASDNEIDLKAIIGSTNEYVEKEKKVVYEYDEKELVDSYNSLLSDFTKYANNHEINTSGNNQVIYNNGGSNIIINGNGSNSSEVSKASNSTNINKRVSLRGAVAYQTHVDVTYSVIDPEDKYQVVYLLVTGIFDDQNDTRKIILDKNENRYRITDLAVNSEYTISLGSIEVVTVQDEKNLVDSIEDVINVRTSKVNYELLIDKIAGGVVYFRYKMPSNFAFSNCDLVLYTDGVKNATVSATYNEITKQNGFSSSFTLPTGSIYEIRVENATYANKIMDLNINRKFVIAK